MRRGMREVITGIGTPLVRKELGLKEADAKAYAWMMVIAFWGMRQLVRDGDISRKRGVTLFGQMVERLRRPCRSAEPPSPPPPHSPRTPHPLSFLSNLSFPTVLPPAITSFPSRPTPR